MGAGEQGVGPPVQGASTAAQRPPGAAAAPALAGSQRRRVWAAQVGQRQCQLMISLLQAPPHMAQWGMCWCGAMGGLGVEAQEVFPSRTPRDETLSERKLINDAEVP